MAKVDLEALERDGTSDVGSSQALLREESEQTAATHTVEPACDARSNLPCRWKLASGLGLLVLAMVVFYARVMTGPVPQTSDIDHPLNAEEATTAFAKAAAAEAAAAALNAKNAKLAAEAKRHAEEVAARNKAIAEAAAAKNAAAKQGPKAAAPAAKAAPAAAAPAPAAAPAGCHTAQPGEGCYGAVLWHKWIGLIESPQLYGGLTRESNRHAIQEWLWKQKKGDCKKPCPGAYPVPLAAHVEAPRVYCFSVARGGPEMDSMFMQRQSGTGIFACNGFDVYSDQSIDIDGYQTKLIPSTSAGVSVDQTAANSQVFMKTWMDILYDNFWYNYDFVVKVDPDAILFPQRLRWHVQSHVGQNVFFLNCAVHAPAMYGAVEVYSKASMGAYKAQHGRCQSQLPFWQWGEDRFMQECLKMLGVAPVGDYTNNVRDARCWGSDCGNKGAVAFHPFKAVNSWYRCYLASA